MSMNVADTGGKLRLAVCPFSLVSPLENHASSLPSFGVWVHEPKGKTRHRYIHSADKNPDEKVCNLHTIM